MEKSPVAALLAALMFAARKHRDQRRKGAGSPPFINHAIEVTDLLARVGGVEDPVTLQAAVLHDTLEDTDTTPGELRAEFGDEVTRVVEEVTDDKALAQAERKRLQIDRAIGLSERARLVRLADKIANVLSVTWTPPVDWSNERRRDYLEWTHHVIEGCRGCNPALERYFDEVLREGMRLVTEEDERDRADR